MMRAMLTLGILVGVVGLCQGEDKKEGDKKAKPATITKVDPIKKTLAVKCKDTTGKDTEKTFKLDDEIRYLDSTGKVAVIEVFQVGNDVLIVEEDGKLKEMRKAPVKKAGTEEKK